VRRLAVLTLLLLASDASASGAIRGTVWPDRAAARHARRERVPTAELPRHGWFDFLLHPFSPGEEPPAAGTARSRDAEIADVIVTVRAIPEATERRLARDAEHTNAPAPEIAMTSAGVRPRVLVVPAGSWVRITNRDAIWHGAFSVSPAARFDFRRVPPGNVLTAWFGHPGVVAVHCDFHADEVGFVKVAPNHAIAQPDSLGRFRLPDLPPGAYDVEVWQPWRGARVQRVVVPKKGDAICDLVF